MPINTTVSSDLMKGKLRDKASSQIPINWGFFKKRKEYNQTQGEVDGIQRTVEDWKGTARQ